MKKLYTLHTIIATLVLCQTAHAGVVLVEDSSNRADIYMVKVISKTPIIEKVPYMITRKYCENHYRTIHYSGTDRNTPVIATTPSLSYPVCNDVIRQDTQSIIKGYRITYDFKGTLKTADLNYEPSEYVQVYNAP